MPTSFTYMQRGVNASVARRAFGDEHVPAEIVRTIAFLTDAYQNRAIALATCDTRSHALSELLDWRSTDVS